MSDLVIKKWLNYWKNNLADADRAKIKVNTNPIAVNVDSFISQVPNRQAEYLWLSSKAPEGVSTIDVIISPCRVGSKYEHAKKKSSEDVVFPFWIPAKMDKQGKLFSPDKALPFFVREYLSPNPEHSLSIASIKEVDDKKSKVDFKEGEWQDYWQKCEQFFHSVTDCSFAEFDTFDNKEVHVELSGVISTTHNIIALYNELEKQSNYPLLLQKLINSTASSKPLLNHYQVQSNLNHIAQMGGSFPLSVSQRQSMATFCQQQITDILAINGPPGTGKTTILQSFVANIFVHNLINDEPPALILASSTNNQAITNILDSFANASEDKFSERWLPDLDALGLYLTGKKSKQHQIMSKPFGNGFFEEFESKSIDTLQSSFLEKFNTHYQTNEKTIKNAFQQLKQQTKSLVQKIQQSILVAKKYEEMNKSLLDSNFKSYDELKNYYLNKQQTLAQQQTLISKLRSAEQTITEQAQNLPWYYKIMGFLSSIKEQKALLFRSKISHLPSLLNLELNWYDHKQIIKKIQKRIISEQLIFNQLNEEVDKLKHLKQGIESAQSDFLDFKETWQQQYKDKLDKLYETTGDEYQGLSALEETNVMLDISYRFEAFWTAVHAREAEYILLLEKRQSKTDKERAKDTYKQKLQRFACLTPVFISTFHSAPKFFSYYDGGKGGEFAYFDLLDYLIVDEAGQVAPEVAIPTFSLAKQAIVVGDTLQIEPVWSVSPQLDGVITHCKGLVSTDEEFNQIEKDGLISSSGSVMKLAQRACEYQQSKLAKGMMLKEHRRCLDSIISYSNRYVYDNELLPKQGNVQKKGLTIPTKGFLHISSESHKQGSSRINKLEASIIAKWINEYAEQFMTVYDKPIEEIVAVVTPYGAQAGVIKKQLIAENSDFKKITCGTVHSLQGAERPIVIFSLVVGIEDKTTFINSGYNMLNVAISRAKHSFLVFGNIDVLHAEQNTPLGNLKKWLIENEDAELSNKLLFIEKVNHLEQEKISKLSSGEVQRLDTLDMHTRYLKEAFLRATEKLVITSPFLSIQAIETDAIIDKINQATKNNVDVVIYTDKSLDAPNGKVKANAQKARDALSNTKATLRIVNGIHNKTIIIDNRAIIEGSFNWLSATRDKTSPFYRHEASICLTDDLAKPLIDKAHKQIKQMDEKG